MKTEIQVRNGSGWNRYQALGELNSLPVGTRGLLKKNGIQTLEIAPADSERPYGIAARYFDADGEEVFCQSFDQNDSAQWIRERVTALLEEGIQNRIAARRAKIAREAFVKRISAWRRNFDQSAKSSHSGDKLRAKFGALRKAHVGAGRPSRKVCWNLTNAVIAGDMSYAAAVSQLRAK